MKIGTKLMQSHCKTNAKFFGWNAKQMQNSLPECKTNAKLLITMQNYCKTTAQKCKINAKPFVRKSG
jgi:hypothetical protein